MKQFIILSFFIFIAGCNKIDINDLKQDTESTISEVIPLEEALANLNHHLDLLYPDTKGSNSERYAISSVESIGRLSVGESTRSETDIPDTLLYLVNFNDMAGFSVLSANTRIGNEIFCIAEAGELVTGDFQEAYRIISKNHNIKIDNNEGFIDDIGPVFVPAILLSSALNIYYSGVSGLWKEIETKALNKIGPHVTTKWHQEYPFNRFTPNNVPVGCVALAVAQIMASNEYSNNMTYYNGIVCDWKTMKSVCSYENPSYNGTEEAQEQVAAFLRELGQSYNCKIRYDNGSYGYADGAKRTFENYGYNNVNKYTGFGNKNIARVEDSVRHYYSAYLDACQEGSTTGHAWVIDGMTPTWFHCNWGWNGIGDGYYNKGVFNTAERQWLDTTIDRDVMPTNHHNYTWAFRLVTFTR